VLDLALGQVCVGSYIFDVHLSAPKKILSLREV
jgi:hypothetical protein